MTYICVLYSQNHRMWQKRMIYVLQNGPVVKRCDRLLSWMTYNCADATRPLLLPPHRNTCGRTHTHVSHFLDFNVPSTAQGHLRTYIRTYARTHVSIYFDLEAEWNRAAWPMIACWCRCLDTSLFDNTLPHYTIRQNAESSQFRKKVILMLAMHFVSIFTF